MRINILSILLLTLTLEVQCQSLATYSLNIHSNTTAEILDRLSLESKMPIYYKAEDFSDAKKSFKWQNQTLQAMLEDALEGNSLIAMNYRDVAFVILPKTSLDRSLVNEYITGLQALSDTEKKVSNDIVTIGSIDNLKRSGKVTISGLIKDGQNNEPIIGAQVEVSEDQVVLTDYNGQYSVVVKPGDYVLKVTYVGYNMYRRDLDVKSDGVHDVILNQEAVNLNEITVTGVSKGQANKEVVAGVTRLDVRALEKLPSFLGEKDIVKAVLINPGVSSIGEGATGYNVRGGNVDQNLMLMDEAILFNASHSMGFFSTFNSDLIRDATLSKSILPAHLGGRMASALEVNMSEGNREKIRVKASFNPAAGTITADGPINKKLTFATGGRATYTNYIFNLFTDENLKQSKLSFFDGFGKVAYKTKKGTISFAGYHSNDEFRYSREFGFDYKTSFLQLGYQSLITAQTLLKAYIVGNKYSSNLQDFGIQTGSNQYFGIDHVKGIIKLLRETKTSKIEYGISSILYDVAPGNITPLSETSLSPSINLKHENGLESSLFFSIGKQLGKILETSVGLRLNHYAATGDKTSFKYDGAPARDNIIDTLNLSGWYGSSLKLEPRVSIKVNITPTFSFKAGVAWMHQYINQIYNTDTPTPTSQWQLSNEHIKPTYSDNTSAGFVKTIDNSNWEMTAEVYYRNMYNVIDYKDFANLVGNVAIERDLAFGKGNSKGIEFSLKKSSGKVNGWATYTLSSTKQQINGINNGNWYSSPFDKPHNFNLIFNYNPIERHTLTASFNYSTGRPTSPPVGYAITSNNVYVPIFSERNQLRVPDYHRLDLSFNIARSHNFKAKRATSWTFLLYNVYARQNPFSLFYLRGEDNLPRVRQLSVVGSIIPAIRLNIEFL